MTKHVSPLALSGQFLLFGMIFLVAVRKGLPLSLLPGELIVPAKLLCGTLLFLWLFKLLRNLLDEADLDSLTETSLRMIGVLRWLGGVVIGTAITGVLIPAHLIELLELWRLSSGISFVAFAANMFVLMTIRGVFYYRSHKVSSSV